jgi:chloramphenicol-sensitive protein RarD
VAHLPPLEVLAHRTLWSLVFFLAYLGLWRRLKEIPAAFGQGRLGSILIAAAMISVNWFLFILATQIDRVTEASMGYFVFPLFAVLLGRFWFGEVLGRLQWVAAALAALGVVALTVGLGIAPWISLLLASTFSVYSVIKKGMQIGPVVSVTCEVILFMPVTVVVLLSSGLSGAAGPSLGDLAILVISGPLTAGPLMLFSYAARHTNMVAIGLVQFINPMLQFFCAVALFAEPFTRWHGLAFALIWAALILYSLSLVRQSKAERNMPTASGTV